jgi:hypothetical protein
MRLLVMRRIRLKKPVLLFKREAERLLFLRLLQAALEAFDLSSRVDQALFASEERMTRRADVDVQPLLR